MAEVDSEALRDWMDAKEWTIKALADEVGISLKYMADIARGDRTLKRNPSLRKQIADALQVPVTRIEKRVEASA